MQKCEEQKSIEMKVHIFGWRIEDENGDSPLDEDYVQEQLHLPHEDTVKIDADIDVNSIDKVVKEKLYKKRGFYPTSFTWVRSQN